MIPIDMSFKKRSGKKAAGLKRFSLFKYLTILCVILLAGLTGFVFMRQDLRQAVTSSLETSRPLATQPSPRPSAVPTADPESSATSGNGGVAEVRHEPALAYETLAYDFEARVRGVDLAILQTLATQGDPQTIMHHRAVEARIHDGQEFFYQNLTITLDQDVFSFLASLRQNLKQFAPEAVLTTVHGNPRDLEIAVLGEPTHHLFLPMTSVPEPVPPLTTQARLVIVIDDLGESASVARRLANLPFLVSFSVLPHATRAREVAALARQRDRELLLHLPCEPDGYPKTANSGPGTLRVAMSPDVLEQTLIDNLACLPEVDGVNNHMGSRLTRDTKAMSIVLAHLKGRGIFFLDSLTTSRSCVRDVSRSLGMRYYRRHIFLDNSAEEHAILLQLKKAESLARRTGVAVAIGHPYPATLSALESWAKDRDTSVIVCKIEDI
jgi:hypothetical protein